MSTTPTSSAHTPGPWYLGKKCPLGSRDITREEFYVYSDKGYIATVPTDLILHVNHQAAANARLIAAAPDMAEKIREFSELSRSVSANWENGRLDRAVRNLVRLADDVDTLLALLCDAPDEP